MVCFLFETAPSGVFLEATFMLGKGRWRASCFAHFISAPGANVFASESMVRKDLSKQALLIYVNVYLKYIDHFPDILYSNFSGQRCDWRVDHTVK